jgi:hypothetical protein
MGARKIYIITKGIVLVIDVVYKIWGARQTSIPKFGQRGQIQDLLRNASWVQIPLLVSSQLAQLAERLSY